MSFKVPGHNMNDHRFILGMRVDCTTFAYTSKRIVELAKKGTSSYICAGTVHMVMECFDDENFRQIVNSAEIVTPDGMPLVWGLKILGLKNAQRVPGPALTPYLCSIAEKENILVGFYGGTEKTLCLMIKNLESMYPSLKIGYAYSPPFRELTDDEDRKIVNEINSSGCKILFVGLGCPKQEKWMAYHKGKINAVMIGVGAAFDFIAGTKPQAPKLIQNMGLEWLFRLLCEPKRLWKRYIYHNPRFIYHFSKQILKDKLGNKYRKK